MIRIPIYPDGLPKLAIEEEAPRDPNPECRDCPLGARVRSTCMSPEIYGDESKGVLLVVGQGPGEAEDRIGRPNVGQSGDYLRKALASRWDGAVVFDNAVRCAPGALKIDTYLRRCRPYVASTFRECRPTKILCLGAAAIHSVVGRSFAPLSTRKGYTWTSEGVPVHFMFHPVMGLRNRFARQWFEEDLDWVFGSNPPTPPLNAECNLSESLSDVQNAVSDMELAGTVTVDIETFGAAFNKEFRVISLSLTPELSDYSYVIPKRQLEDERVVSAISEYLARAKVVGQNVKFDAVGLRAAFGVRMQVEFDTMLARRLLHSGAMARLEYQQCLVGMAGAKDEVKPHIDAGVRHLRKMLKKPEVDTGPFGWLPAIEVDIALDRIAEGDNPKRYAFAAIPEREMSSYNARDTLSTSMLHEHFSKLMDARRPGVGDVWDKIGRELNHAFTEMEINGIAVDRAAIYHLKATMQAKLDETMGRLKQYGEDFNPNAPKQVGELLFGTLGLPHKGKTATGMFSTTKEILEGLDHPAAKDIVEFRRAQKFKSQYADGMLVFIRDDGRVHPNYKMGGTETGRPSCEEPNLFNIPKRTAEGKLCRTIFVAPPDRVLVEGDYSQAELRVAAMLSGDETMLELFASGADFHLETARLIAPIFKVDPSEVTAEHQLRDQAKTTNFATLYGDPPAGLAAKLRISKAMAVKLQDAILGKFPRLKEWIQARLRHARKTGSCRTWWDGADFRERSLWQIADADGPARDTAERSSWNTPVQGTATEYTNASLGKVQRWIEDDGVPAKLVMTLYDAIFLEVSDLYVASVAEHLKAIMEGWPTLHGMKMVADIKVGRSWGTMVDLEEWGVKND